MLGQEYEGRKQEFLGTGNLFLDMSASHLNVFILCYLLTMIFAILSTSHTPLKQFKMYPVLYKLNQRVLRKRFYANLENDSSTTTSV